MVVRDIKLFDILQVQQVQVVKYQAAKKLNSTIVRYLSSNISTI